MPRLSPRDDLIVSTVARFRQVRAKQIERLVFPDASPISRDRWCRLRLQKLSERGLINRLPRSIGGLAGSEGFVYQRPKKGKRSRRTPDPHALLLTEVYVRVNTPAALAVRGGGSVRASRGPDGGGATWTRRARSLA
jgi:hypothetical protein